MDVIERIALALSHLDGELVGGEEDRGEIEEALDRLPSAGDAPLPIPAAAPLWVGKRPPHELDPVPADPELLDWQAADLGEDE